MIITLEILFGIFCLIGAIFGMYAESHTRKWLEIIPILKRTSYALQFFGSGIYLIVLLQVFNWFPAHRIHWVMALWTMMQGLGCVTNILIESKYTYIKWFVMGPIYLVLPVIDYFTFRMHPAQENIFFEVKQKDGTDKKEKEQLEMLASHLRVKRGDNFSVFDSQNKSNLRVTLPMAFRDQKIW